MNKSNWPTSLGHQASFFFGPLPIRVRVAALNPSAQLRWQGFPHPSSRFLKKCALPLRGTVPVILYDRYGWRAAKWDELARNPFNV